MSKFEFLENDFGQAFLPHFACDFSRKKVSHFMFY